ncbi:MAG: SEL1-like repeat protein [Enhydrobacter sp.]|nr:MAG: SEL1-like repeat protein [Enhydrobacter sp.]
MMRSVWRNLLIAAVATASPAALGADPQSSAAPDRTQGQPADDISQMPLDELRRRANTNELPAMEEMGRRLIQGMTAPKDPQAGAGWLLRAAELGSPSAAFSVGVMYERGFVVERDSTRAVEWYRRAVDGNVPSAKHNLALMLRDGKGTPRDAKAAAELLRSAAKQGMAASMFTLGDMYERGDAGAKDATAALAWFSIAAEFDRQANGGQETPLVKSADQRSQTLQRILTPTELLQAQDVAQQEFKAIVEALSPPKPTKPVAAAEPPTTTPAAEPAPTPPPSPPSTPPLDDEALGWPKTSAEQIRAVQQALVDMKLLGGKPDGVLGPRTRTAIRDFQGNAGMRETGEPSRELFLALKVAQRGIVEHSALPTPPKADPPPPEPPKEAAKAAIDEPKAPTEPPTTTSDDIARTDRDVWPKTRADQIRAIQRLLTELRYYDAALTGQLGKLTRAAILDYQRTRGLKQTGEPSEALFESLKEMRGLMTPKPNQ